MAQKKTKKTGTKRGSVETQNAITALREAHKIGKKLLKETPTPVHGDHSADRAAKKYGMSSSTILKRRVLAKTFPDLTDLDEFFELMREHDSPVGVSLFTRALESEDKRPASQKKLLHKVIKEKLSRGQIDQIISERSGSRRAGGKKHQVKTAGQCLAKLKKSCITITKLCDQADEAGYLDKLPKKLRKKIESLAHSSQAMVVEIEADRVSRQSRREIRRKK